MTKSFLPNWPGFLLVAASEISILRAYSAGIAAKKSSSLKWATSCATYRHLILGLVGSPLLISTHLPPIGRLPVLAMHSSVETSSQTSQFSIN